MASSWTLPPSLRRRELWPTRDRVEWYERQRARDEEGGRYDWRSQARAKQWPPDGSWHVWLVLAGRGFGKTRTGAEWVRMMVEQGQARRVALVGPTAADVRDVMVEGESGLLAVCPPWDRPVYEPSKRRLTWGNGAVATTFSADEPDRLRGPQHDLAWCDELASWRHPEAWDMLLFGLRLGRDPRVVVTTTPRPTKLIKQLVDDKGVVVVRGSTFENEANMAPTFFEQIRRRYEGTRLGLQELEAQILDDVPGALWTRTVLEETRVTTTPDLVRIVVGVDPAASDGEGAAETGIIVVGLGRDGHGYVLDDLSIRASPAGWAAQVIAGYHKFQADRIVAEVNQGGDMVEHTIRMVDAGAAVRQVRASRGKAVRAEPIAALYEQGRMHHLGVFADLEEQLCGWTPGEKSPDRCDALVWAATELMLGERAGMTVDPYLAGAGEALSMRERMLQRRKGYGDRD